MCRLWGKKIFFRYICLNISVHVLIKAGGLRCTGWGGGGLSPRRANTLHVRIEHICVKVVVFFLRVLSCIAKKANDMYACFGVKTVIVTNKVPLN